MFRLLTLPSVVLVSVGATFLFNADLYQAPICGFYQTCSSRNLNASRLLGMPKMSLCSCPDDNECSEDFFIDIKQIRYSFCHPIALLTCVEKEIAMILHDLQTTIRCDCPDTHTIRQVYQERGAGVILPDVYFECVRRT